MATAAKSKTKKFTDTAEGAANKAKATTETGKRVLRNKMRTLASTPLADLAETAAKTPKRARKIAAGPLTKADTIKHYGARTLGQLNMVLTNFPLNSTFQITADSILVFNMRGRQIGQIRRVDKVVIFAPLP